MFRLEFAVFYCNYGICGQLGSERTRVEEKNSFFITPDRPVRMAEKHCVRAYVQSGVHQLVQRLLDVVDMTVEYKYAQTVHGLYDLPRRAVEVAVPADSDYALRRYGLIERV